MSTLTNQMPPPGPPGWGQGSQGGPGGPPPGFGGPQGYSNPPGQFGAPGPGNAPPYSDRTEPYAPSPYPPNPYPPQPYPGNQTYPVPPGYGPPPAGASPVGAGVLGKRRNPFAVWLGLPIITLGIYSLVWVYKTNKELSAYNPRIQVNPALSVLAYVIGWVLIVPPFVATWRLGTRTRDAQRAAGLPELSPGVAFVLWLVGGGALYLQYEINKIWARYPGAVEGQQVPLSF
ncbi:protein of unknown function (DUF4234) [Parafrankia irregularis]|uniref:DUF4234 domain-containing protein n=1 Tax=Parafrankia irregularis TaxID=795642 RepID=A0A0S4QYM3_9ACTN|nr:conserved hypothetical protein [Parafrankia sp. EUN1f]CUU60388.1 protein of unknown function (DUF4234) [Parafrankia irregularis]